MAVDLLAHLAPGLTPYRYGFNNPISYTDPFGLFETRREARRHRRKNRDVKGRVVKQDDGTFAIENKRESYFVQRDLETGQIYEGALAVRRGLHLADIGLDGATEIAERNPDAVLYNNNLDRAYYWGKALSFAMPSWRLASARSMGQANRNTSISNSLNTVDDLVPSVEVVKVPQGQLWVDIHTSQQYTSVAPKNGAYLKF